MILPGFDTFVAIDWSGARNSYKGIAVAKCSRGRSAPKLVPSKVNAHWTRTEIADWLCGELNGASRVLVGDSLHPLEHGLRNDHAGHFIRQELRVAI